MCGIAGIALRRSGQTLDKDVLRRMAVSLSHRGPDDRQIYAVDNCGLAMSRLAVIDVDHGRQPVANEDRSVVAVVNGEIYNYRELSAELHAAGHVFRSQCDIEVVVHLYEEYGIEFVSRLDGMFAIALWDQTRKQLVLARDRMGVKPLYYYQQDSGVTFGSEIKAVLQNPNVPRSVDLKSIDHLLRFGYFSPERSPLCGLVEVAPATIVTYRDGVIESKPYWDFADQIEAASMLPDRFNSEVSLDGLREKVTSAVAARLNSDVPLGAFLSGGIDSSVVVALMSKLLDEPFDTFSLGFSDVEFDERPYARAVAKQCGTRHHEVVVSPNLEQLIPSLILHHDAPFYDTSAIPTYCLCEYAKEHVTVAMSGDGGDELFAGYNIFLASRFASFYSRLPRVVRNGIHRLARLIPETSGYLNKGRVLREFLAASDLQPIERYSRWNAKIKFEDRYALYRNEQLQDCLHDSDVSFFADDYFRFEHASELSRQLFLATRHELAGDMLTKVDRMSMAHGLEVRSPLLSYRLFEFSAKLPDRAKVGPLRGKRILRRLAEELLPKKIVRRPKRGFCVPIDRWLRTNLAEFTRDILLDPMTVRRGLFRLKTVESFLQEHQRGHRSRSREIWTMLTIELWHRMYIDEQPHLPAIAANVVSDASLKA